MLDIKYIKENTDFVKDRLKTRCTDYSKDIDNLVSLYSQRNELIFNADNCKAKQNAVSKDIPQLKKEGKPVDGLFAEMKQLSDEIKEFDAKISVINNDIDNILYGIPNIPFEDVPTGESSADNVVVRSSGTPRKFDFTPLPHWEVGVNLGILDPERAAKVTGARFDFYIGDGARLERALISYYLDTHRKSGYLEVFPPFIVNSSSMRGTGQLPKFAEDAFKLEGYDYYLVPTAEVPVTNYHSGEILNGEQLPLKYCAYSACFRAEAGSAGRDTRGLVRRHQFNKVELLKFSLPENSFDELEGLTNDAEKVLAGLGAVYRVVLLCTGDVGFSSAKTYDLEVYMPSYGGYVEISSCSNFMDFQARRAGIRFKNDSKDKARYVHTLNGSGVAIGRSVAYILENYQNSDGSVTIPEVLRPYMNGQSVITTR